MASSGLESWLLTYRGRAHTEPAAGAYRPFAVPASSGAVVAALNPDLDEGGQAAVGRRHTGVGRLAWREATCIFDTPKTPPFRGKNSDLPKCLVFDGNVTPLCASEISPGIGIERPPTSPASEIVW